MKKVALYARVSSDRQAQEGDSIPAQLDALRKWAASRHYEVVGEYVDDGVSGTKVDRDELQRLLTDVKAGKIEQIAFTKLDRWFRSVRHYTVTQAILDKCGVEWLAIWEPIYDTTTPQGRLIVNQMASIAQFEAENTGSRIRQVFNYKVQQGEVIAGKCPLGYSIVNKHYVPNEQAPAVLDAFERFNFCQSVGDVGRYIMDKYGIVRDRSTWRRILGMRIYTGEYRGNPNYCEPIVPIELFESVQRALPHGKKDNVRRYEYIFSGLCICPECGLSMTGKVVKHVTKQGELRIYRGYRCRRPNKVRGWHGSSMKYEATIERYLVAHVAEEAKKEKLIITRKIKEPADLGEKVNRLKKKMGRLKELYINELITLDEYRSDRDRYTAELEALEAREQPDTSKLDKIIEFDFQSIYGTLSDEEKAFLWRSVLKEIRFDNGQIRPVFL